MTAPPDFSQSSTPYSLLAPRHPPHALSSLATLFAPSTRAALPPAPPFGFTLGHTSRPEITNTSPNYMRSTMFAFSFLRLMLESPQNLSSPNQDACDALARSRPFDATSYPTKSSKITSFGGLLRSFRYTPHEAETSQFMYPPIRRKCLSHLRLPRWREVYYSSASRCQPGPRFFSRHSRGHPDDTDPTLCLSFSYRPHRPLRIVETRGFEPLTPCLQSRCSPS